MVWSGPEDIELPNFYLQYSLAALKSVPVPDPSKSSMIRFRDKGTPPDLRSSYWISPPIGSTPCHSYSCSPPKLPSHPTIGCVTQRLECGIAVCRLLSHALLFVLYLKFSFVINEHAFYYWFSRSICFRRKKYVQTRD